MTGSSSASIDRELHLEDPRERRARVQSVGSRLSKRSEDLLSDGTVLDFLQVLRDGFLLVKLEVLAVLRAEAVEALSVRSLEVFEHLDDFVALSCRKRRGCVGSR